MLAGLAVQFRKTLGKVGVAHVAHFRKIIYLQILPGMPVDVDRHILDRIRIRFGRRFRLKRYALLIRHGFLRGRFLKR